jgi:hypothetical protein
MCRRQVEALSAYQHMGVEHDHEALVLVVLGWVEAPSVHSHSVLENEYGVLLTHLVLREK